MGSSDVFIGRQPIFDTAGNIYAYELLYRNSEENYYPNIDPETATIKLIINTFLTVGVDQVVGKSKSFINFSEKLIEEDLIRQLDPNIVIIEILEDTEITPLFIERIKQLKRQGFRIALDDYVIEEYNLLHDELFKYVNIIKVDFLDSTYAERLKLQSILKKHTNIILLAEKVETYEQFDEAKNLGYLLFQGYFFAKPEIVKGKDIPMNYPLHLQLFHKLNEEEPNIDEISRLIMHDLSLSYKLLRYINSVAFGIPNHIHSIKQAIMMMGLEEARKWMRIILLHHMGDGKDKGREQAIISESLTRAKMCELMAKHTRKQNIDEYFLLGMFSMLNVILKRSWDDVLPQLAMPKAIANTLKGEETEMLPYLQVCEAVIRFNWDKLETCLHKVGISESQLSKISIEAHRWASNFKY